jgi:FMN-dependent NADH-azoreductase
VKLLHIVATPREQESNTLNVSKTFLESIQARYSDLEVDEIKLFEHGLPSVAGDNIESKYTLVMGQPIDKRHQESWTQIEVLIKHFLSANIYLISTPMWNFSIPYALKYYIDAIIQPGYLYRYNEIGQPVPLTLGKKMLCITSRGGDYAPGGPFQAYDFQEPYLRAIFGYVGIYDMQFINAQPMDVSMDLRKVAMASAIEKARSLANTYDWGTVENTAAVENPVELKPKPINA